MVKYYWTREEEARLLELWKQGIRDPNVLAKELGRKLGAIRKKLARMAVVVGEQTVQRTTTTEVTAKDIITHEQALKFLVGALNNLQQPGQDKLELQRLRILVDALQGYDSVLEKFERWCEIESRLLEMGRKIQEIEKELQKRKTVSA
jgi:hypothetical protein